MKNDLPMVSYIQRESTLQVALSSTRGPARGRHQAPYHRVRGGGGGGVDGSNGSGRSYDNIVMLQRGGDVNASKCCERHKQL